MAVLALIYIFIWWAATAMGAAGIILIVLRSLFIYLEVNPFTWHSRNVRRVTDPVIAPARRMLIGLRLDPVVAPLIVVVLLILVLVLMVQLAGSILNMIAGILHVIANRRAGGPMAIAGYLLFGFLGLYTVAIFARIIVSWVGADYRNRFARFLIQLTEPLLGPLRRWVPRVGMFDISPIVAFLILWVGQSVVAATMLRDWPVRFF